MTETVEQTIEAPAAPRKPKPVKRRRRQVKRAAPAAAKAPRPAPNPSEFPGLTPAECSLECRADRCAITHRGLCGHPCKGGLQGRDLHNPEVGERFARAKKQLDHLLIDGKK